jgi:hypothetical protein
MAKIFGGCAEVIFWLGDICLFGGNDLTAPQNKGKGLYVSIFS